MDYAIKVLNEQVKELSKKIQREEDKNLCKICFSREIDTVLMECCHFILCFACTTNLKNVMNSAHSLVSNLQKFDNEGHLNSPLLMLNKFVEF